MPLMSREAFQDSRCGGMITPVERTSRFHDAGGNRFPAPCKRHRFAPAHRPRCRPQGGGCPLEKACRSLMLEGMR